MARRLHRSTRLTRIERLDQSAVREILAAVEEARGSAALDLMKAARSPRGMVNEAVRLAKMKDALSKLEKTSGEIERILKGSSQKTERLAAEFADSDLKASTDGEKGAESDPKRFAETWGLVNESGSGRVGQALSDSLKRWTSSELRKASREVWRKGEAEGWSIARREKEIAARWTEFAGKLAGHRFVALSGRELDDRIYVKTLVRTVHARTVRETYFDDVLKAGVDLVIIENADGDACPKCAEYDRQIISISGTDDRFPSYAEALQDGWAHPNCRCHAEAVDPKKDAQAISDQAD